MSEEKKGNELIALVKKKPLEIFTKDGITPVLEIIKKEVAKFEPDITTEKGRKEIKAMARKINRTKTTLDDMGKELVSDWKSKSKLVDESRKKLRDELDALKMEKQKPLTDWEDEKKSKDLFGAKRREDIEELSNPYKEDGSKKCSAELTHSLAILENYEVNEGWGDHQLSAEEEIKEGIEKLKTLIQEMEKQEKEQKELQELRDKQAKRDEEDRIKKIKDDAEKQAKIDAEKKVQKELEDAARKKQEAEDQERLAKIEREENKKKIAKLEEDNKRKIKDAKEKADRDKEEARKKAVIDEQKRVKLEKQRLEEEDTKRQEDKEHRKKINNAAMQAIARVGVDSVIAQKIVVAIICNEIPNVSIKY